MLSWLSRLVLLVAAVCLVLALSCSAAAIQHSHLQDEDTLDQQPRRVQRSFDGGYSNYFGQGLGGGAQNTMVNWKAALSKRGPVDKRQFEFYPASHFGSGLDRAAFQDWSATFGRNYRSFGTGGYGSLGGSRPGSFGAGHDNLQNWHAFFGRHSRSIDNDVIDQDEN